MAVLAHRPGSGSPAGGGPRPTSPAGGGSPVPAPAQAGSSNARPRDSPRRLPLHPSPEARPHSPPQAGPRELLLSAARRRLRPVAVHLLSLQAPARPSARRSRPVTVPRAPAASFAPVSTADTAGPTTEGLSADSADTTSSNAAARALASGAARRSRPPLEPRPVTRWMIVRPGPPNHHQPARAATSETEPRATEPAGPSEAARSTTYVHSVPLTTWRVPSSKPTKPTTPR